MEIKLSDADMRALADLTASKLEEKLVRIAVSTEAFNTVAEKARAWAELHFKGERFHAEAVAHIRKALEEGGHRMLRQIMREALQEQIKSDPTLVKTAKTALASIITNELSRVQELLETKYD